MNILSLQKMKQESKKIAMITCYDASFAEIINDTPIDVLLVGDTLGTVIQGEDTTIPVTIEQMTYHTTCVTKTAQNKLIIADLPFMTYSDEGKAIDHATELMQSGAHMVKLEGGAWLKDSVRKLTQCGIPVCCHLGLTPQSVHQLGGYKKQGKEHHAAEKILDDAVILEQAGASLLVLECIPSVLAEEITKNLKIPTIGIGAGPYTDGQVMVLYDILGISSGHIPKFAKNFMPNQTSIKDAINAYAKAVKNEQFPEV